MSNNTFNHAEAHPIPGCHLPAENVEPTAGFLGALAKGLCKQGAAQVVCAICFLLLASDKYSPLASDSITWTILFIQWQVLGLTIAKLGAEQTVFAAVSRNPGIRFNARRHVLKRALPLAMLFSIPVTFVFSPWAAPVLVASIALDTWSVMLAADNNARGNLGVTAVARLLNYPLFFAILFTGAAVSGWSLHGILIAFFASSLARWGYLVMRPAPNQASPVEIRNNLPMGIQQGMNFGMFRLDEVLLAMVVIGAGMACGQEYVFQARFPQMISMMALLAGVVLFPHFYLEQHGRGIPHFGATPFRGVRLWAMVAAGVIGVTVMFILYRRLMWAGTTTLPGLPFILHGCAVMPVNLITYSMLRQGCIRGLLRNMAGGLAVGQVYLWLALAAGYEWPVALAWLSAIQLYGMIAFSFLFNWGKPSRVHG